MMQKTDLKNFDLESLIRYVEGLGQPAFRGRQIMSWLYRPGISAFDQMTDIAKKFREILKETACISNFKEPILERSQDGCIKFGFHLDDGHIVESVLIPEEDRNTLCLSSQVGCAMNCSFCLTGTMGFTRNLTPAEMVNQVCAVRDFLLAEPAENLTGPREVTNLVFMGMGEPLNNLDNLLTALSILTEPKGLDFTGRKVTVSTCGIAPKLKKLGENSTVNLAISLHAVDDATRDLLMPVNTRYPLDVLLEACRTYPMPKRRRIMFEYILLKGINDSDEQAYELARKLHKIPCKINLYHITNLRFYRTGAQRLNECSPFRKFYSTNTSRSLSVRAEGRISPLPAVSSQAKISQANPPDLIFSLCKSASDVQILLDPYVTSGCNMDQMEESKNPTPEGPALS